MLIFLDLETTGLEDIDKICSIAVIVVDKNEIVQTSYELVNEGKKISPKASSVNHLTNEMLKDKVNLKDSKTYKLLEKYNEQNSTIIAHNIKFDLKMLSLVGFSCKAKVIDTLRVTKHLIPECEYFSLQFLRYELRLYKTEYANSKAHEALSDAYHVKQLYEYLLDMAVHNVLVDLSSKNVLLSKFNFGKYKDKHIEEVAMYDRNYLEWMLNTMQDMDEDLRYSIEYYL